MNNWKLVYDGFDPAQEGLREALCTLGNGCFATRGAAPERAADEVHYPGTFLAGGYNRLQSEIAGRVIENEDLVNLPNWLSLSFRIEDDEWFDLRRVEITSYLQELDLKTGVLTRTVRFRDVQGRCTKLTQRRLVHMAYPHIAALESVWLPENWSGRMEVRSALDGGVTNSGVPRYRNLNGQHLVPMETARMDEDAIYLKVQTSQSELRVAQAARTQLFAGEQRLAGPHRVEEKPGYIAQYFTVDMTAGREIRAEKSLALFTSRDRAIAECGLAAREHLVEMGRFAESPAQPGQRLGTVMGPVRY